MQAPVVAAREEPLPVARERAGVDDRPRAADGAPLLDAAVPDECGRAATVTIRAADGFPRGRRERDAVRDFSVPDIYRRRRRTDADWHSNDPARGESHRLNARSDIPPPPARERRSVPRRD